MEICRTCQKKMSDASVTTCTGDTIIKYPNGKILQRIPYNPREAHLPQWFRCPDCNVAPGGYHHWNCEQEQCPQCRGQLISCSCFDDEGAEDEADN